MLALQTVFQHAEDGIDGHRGVFGQVAAGFFLGVVGIHAQGRGEPSLIGRMVTHAHGQRQAVAAHDFHAHVCTCIAQQAGQIVLV